MAATVEHDHGPELLERYVGDPLKDPMRNHIRLVHGHLAKISVPENRRLHDELHEPKPPVPLICRLGLHRWWICAANLAGHQSWRERMCKRVGCEARERQRCSYFGRPYGRWIREPKHRCTHGSDGGPVPSCMRCANERSEPWA